MMVCWYWSCFCLSVRWLCHFTHFYPPPTLFFLSSPYPVNSSSCHPAIVLVSSDCLLSLKDTITSVPFFMCPMFLAILPQWWMIEKHGRIPYFGRFPWPSASWHPNNVCHHDIWVYTMRHHSIVPSTSPGGEGTTSRGLVQTIRDLLAQIFCDVVVRYDPLALCKHITGMNRSCFRYVQPNLWGGEMRVKWIWNLKNLHQQKKEVNISTWACACNWQYRVYSETCNERPLNDGPRGTFCSCSGWFSNTVYHQVNAHAWKNAPSDFWICLTISQKLLNQS